jgi:D-alanyl-D-alanine dipeptidase
MENTECIPIFNKIDSEKILVDVCELSKQLCSYPIQGKLLYATHENFLGRVVDGYSEEAQNICLLTKATAFALCQVQNELNISKLGLFIFDAYRPLKAVKDFAKWFDEPIVNENELQRKKIHFPKIKHKKDLVTLGYAPDVTSRHNFGHSVDLTLIDIVTGKELDMGACFDFFDDISHSTATVDDIGKTAFENRIILTKVMQKNKFIPYDKEFWHFDYYKQEVEIPMDISIIENYRGLNCESKK